MARNDVEEDQGIQESPPEPIRTVERELTRPDGTTVTVQVPVYPPFKLEGRTRPQPPTRPRPTGKRKRSESS
jgi:hypothetical protein